MTEVAPQEPAAAPVSAPASAPPAGWYDDGSGRQRWFDGTKWSEQYLPAPTTPATRTAGPLTSGSLNVKREVSYVRQQQGHSLGKHLLFGTLILWVNVIYITASPNHYWHA